MLYIFCFIVVSAMLYYFVLCFIYIGMQRIQFNSIIWMGPLDFFHYEFGELCQQQAFWDFSSFVPLHYIACIIPPERN